MMSMNIEDLPYVVNNLKSVDTLIYETLEKFFYDLKQREYIEYNSDRIKANLEAISALCGKTFDILLEIAKNTEDVVLDDEYYE